MFLFFYEYTELAVKKQARAGRYSDDTSVTIKPTPQNSFQLFKDFFGPKAILGILFPIICAAPKRNAAGRKE